MQPHMQNLTSKGALTETPEFGLAEPLPVQNKTLHQRAPLLKRSLSVKGIYLLGFQNLTSKGALTETLGALSRP